MCNLPSFLQRKLNVSRYITNRFSIASPLRDLLSQTVILLRTTTNVYLWPTTIFLEYYCVYGPELVKVKGKCFEIGDGRRRRILKDLLQARSERDGRVFHNVLHRTLRWKNEV